MKTRLLPIFAVLAACSSHPSITVDPGAYAFAIGELVRMTPYPRLAVGAGGDFAISVADDAAIPAEGYRVEATSKRSYVVHAHDVLGAQYGVADALENLGVRFRHPFDTYVPSTPADHGRAGPTHQPEVRVRGLHVHTLHPIEGYFALWEPSAASTEQAHRIVNWIVANRGNYLQWAALEDIILDPARHAAWLPFTQEIIEYAHQRGVRVGLNVQLFGKSNLQLAFDFVDDASSGAPFTAPIAARLPLVTDGLAFDVYDLSYGEFYDLDPQSFIDGTNQVRTQLRALAPQAEMHALVHVGGTQRVTYMGKDMPYYFLVQYADPSIVPDIHTVMYFDLYEPADGAYQQVDFSEHRQYLLDRMAASQKAAYHPESAYWCGFDDSVPQLLPLYVHSRWLDLHGLESAGSGPLDEHLEFSSGWEWGYWLHDVAALRMAYELPAAPGDLIADQLAPELDASVAAVIDHLASDQHDALMTHALASYFAGRDLSMDAGKSLGIVSVPPRVGFDDLVASGDTTGFSTSVLAPLGQYADALDARQKELDALHFTHDRWSDELRDGLEVDRLRARFVLATYGAVVDKLSGGDGQKSVQLASQLLDDAKKVVKARHGDLHDPDAKQIVGRGLNQTFYQYGYLYMADTLCYWTRELVQVQGVLSGQSATVPDCLF